MISYNVHTLIRQQLSTFLRQPVRLAWLEALLAPSNRMWLDYLSWRLEKVYEAHVTSQTISIEAYLNRLFDPVMRRIRIIHGRDYSVYLSLVGEVSDKYIPGDDGLFLPLEGEQQGELEGFVVQVPTGINTEQVAGVVDKIKAAGIVYSIEEV